MKKQIHYICSLCLYSDTLSGKEMADIIGLKPTRFWSKGETMKDGFNKYRQNGYIIDFYKNIINIEEKNTEIDIYLIEEIEDFLNKILEYKDGLLKITQTEKSYITIGIYGVDIHTGFFMPSKITKKLVDLNIDLNVDIYGKG